MAKDSTPPKNYVPMYPKGMDSKKAPPGDGGGKGNVAPSQANPPKGKGNPVKR